MPYKKGTKFYRKKVTVEGRYREVKAKTKKELEEKAKRVRAELQAEVEREKQLAARVTVNQLAERWIDDRKVIKHWDVKHENDVRSKIKCWIVCDPDLGAANIAAYNKEKHIRVSQSVYSHDSKNHDGFPPKAGTHRRRRKIDEQLEHEREERLRVADPRPTLKGKEVDKVTRADLREIILGMEAGGYSYSAVKKVRDILKQMFAYAHAEGLCVVNPAEGLELPGKLPKGERRSITPIERDTTLKIAETHRGGTFVLIMLFTGLRPQEVARLKWSCVDLENKMITVEAALKNYDEEGSPKTDAGFRIVPIPDYLFERLAQAKKKSGYVWTATDGSPATTTNVNRMWSSFKRAMHKAVGAKTFKGLVIDSQIGDDLTLYDYRHTYATDLQAAGVPIGVAKELLGHSQVSVTADIYTHQSAAPTYDALQKLNRFYEK